MSLDADLLKSSRPDRLQSALARSISSRLKGPGGYYNLGNLLGLSVSLSLQLANALSGPGEGAASVLHNFFFGSPAAVALTLATVIFLIGGEIYRAAWSNGAPPDKRLNRTADLVSAVGATMLSVSLLLMGQTFLALVSGLLIAGGKLGSALTGDDPNEIPLWPLHWPDPLRGAVLVGRIPGLAAVVSGLFAALASGHLIDIVQPATLVVCYLLWIKADVMLINGARAQAIRPLSP